MTPISTDHFAKTAPEELSGNTGEENVVRVFGNPTEWADARTRAISLAHLHPGRDPAVDPLPHEDAAFQGQADGPHHRKGEGGRGRGDGQV